MRHRDAARWARQLHRARNDSSHSSKNADGPAIEASEAASKILGEARHHRANEALALYRRATMTDAKELRQRLIPRAKSGENIRYHEAAEALGLDFDDKLQRRFFVDALNDTADENNRRIRTSRRSYVGIDQGSPLRVGRHTTLIGGVWVNGMPRPRTRPLTHPSPDYFSLVVQISE
jgi:hypothetical protein